MDFPPLYSPTIMTSNISLPYPSAFMPLPTSQQPRVLFVNHTAVLGGGELSLLDLATAYCDTCQVLLFDQGPFVQRLQEAGVNVTVKAAPAETLAAKASGGLGAVKVLPGLWQMAQRIKQESQHFDIVHTNSQKAFVAGAIAHFLGGPPVVWHLRDILTANHFSPLNRRLAVTLANRQASRVIVNSQATGAAFVAAGGNPDLVSVIYNGISAAPFDELKEGDRTTIRATLNLAEETPVVGLFSRLSYWKGQHVLLEALRQHPEVHALLVGDALFGEDAYVADLKALATHPDLNGRVHWLGFRDDIPQLMQACDIVVHTSTAPEPFGRVIVEGQLAQRPVIAAADGGAVELIEDGQTGRLVLPGDAEALAQAIQELLIQPEQARAIAQRGYHHAKTTFSLNSLLEQFDDALQNIHNTSITHQ